MTNDDRGSPNAIAACTLLLAAGLWLMGCSHPPPNPLVAPVDASDAAASAPCEALCANLTRLGCRPSDHCVEVCDRAMAAHLIDTDAMACATKAGDARIAAVCGGGFCR